MVSLVLALLYFWKVPHGHVILNAVALIAVGFMVYGQQVLVGVAAADFSSKKAVGMATGLTGTFGSVGGAISGVGVGYIADRWRSEEHTSELTSLMRISYAVFCLQKKTTNMWHV